jgi:hypothetical protein
MRIRHPFVANPARLPPPNQGSQASILLPLSFKAGRRSIRNIKLTIGIMYTNLVNAEGTYS